MKTRLLTYTILGAAAWLLCGCEQQENLPALTARQRELIDTLYLRQVAVIRPQMDSACNADFAQNLARAVDSLVQVRREEAARLRERILQTPPQ